MEESYGKLRIVFSKRGPEMCTSVASTWSPFCLEREAEEEHTEQPAPGKGVGEKPESMVVIAVSQMRYFFLVMRTSDSGVLEK